ncbi:hypothetical protein [Methylobacterium oxalidis]|uniref:hypothetical protein n=1 Tax=Methylobacterium oxalidis TaxID=944322 RepID=UPI001EDD828C|nr:hypothetical protein [Methylobacterium oxalidis]
MSKRSGRQNSKKYKGHEKIFHNDSPGHLYGKVKGRQLVPFIFGYLTVRTVGVRTRDLVGHSI